MNDRKEILEYLDALIDCTNESYPELIESLAIVFLDRLLRIKLIFRLIKTLFKY